jgi:hypothetical protein
VNDIIHVDILNTDLSDNLGNHIDIRETVMRSRVRLDFPEFRKLDAIPKRFLYVYVKVDSDMAVYSSFSSFLSLFRIFTLFYITLSSMSWSATFRKHWFTYS